MSSSTISELLKQSREHLLNYKLVRSRQESSIITEEILSDILGVKRTYLYENNSRLIKRNQVLLYIKLFNSFVSGEPLAYVLGYTEFMGMRFSVNRDTLIPRSDTEFIVEKAIKLMQELPNKRIIILDIGTGAGNIAIAIAKYSSNKNLLIFASDISEAALKIARKNAKANNVVNKIIFCQGDLYSAFKKYDLTQKVDFILSNPPYIARKYASKLPYSVRKYEPKIALYADSNGIDIHKRIIDGSIHYLTQNGFLIMEMGLNQSRMLKMKLKNTSPLFCDIEILKDYANHPRVICVRYSP
jgi:release factor glutamine methyltransferase